MVLGRSDEQYMGFLRVKVAVVFTLVFVCFRLVSGGRMVVEHDAGGWELGLVLAER